jgi:hypothetical protein
LPASGIASVFWHGVASTLAIVACAAVVDEVVVGIAPAWPVWLVPFA